MMGEKLLLFSSFFLVRLVVLRTVGGLVLDMFPASLVLSSSLLLSSLLLFLSSSLSPSPCKRSCLPNSSSSKFLSSHFAILSNACISSLLQSCLLFALPPSSRADLEDDSCRATCTYLPTAHLATRLFKASITRLRRVGLGEVPG